ncbi:MAG: methyl-accepting chemotaxis protein [Geobacter sp.]|nr:methyl-accepting chemotaxis protein [Geobacter sp.]
MTIKTKLTMNVVIVILIIAAVAIASIIGMSSVKSKLTYLTQRSTPYQMRTVEFQRSLQSTATDLLKVGTSRNADEYRANRSEAEKSLAEVKSSQAALEELSGDKMEAYNDLSTIATELFTVSDGRLKADEAASAAGKVIAEKLREATGRLKQLDAKIKGLQTSSASSYTKSLGSMNSISAGVRNIEQLKLTLKDFQLGFMEVQKAQNKKGVLIAQGKCNSSMSKTLQNDYLKTQPSLASDIKVLSQKVPEYIKLQNALVGQAGADTAPRDTLQSDMTERLNAIVLAVEQEAAMATSRFNDETRRQGTIFGNSTLATSVLAGNSELVSLGFNVEGLTSRLFTSETPKEIDAVEAELKGVYGRIATVKGELGKNLTKLNARQETALLRGAEAALGSIANLLFVKDGVISKLRNRLDMVAKAGEAAKKLREVVAQQAEKGKKTVSIAQGDQEKAVATVNRMVRFSITLIAAIGIGAILFGILFGAWIYRSIAHPLNQLIGAAEQVAKGDLSLHLDKSGNDEVGKVQSSMGTMVDNLQGIVGKIKDATQSLASSSEELSATSNALERGAEDQNSRVEQSAAAMTEMTQTTMDVARNASDTATAADRMKKIADDGKSAMHTTVQELNKFAETVKESAAKVESLGQQSDEINNVVTLIKDIADQTNLLALNAAIEAARAGDMGRGFAVVADEVRALAEKTTSATEDIAKTVRQMQGSVADSVTFMKDERDSVSSVLDYVNRTLSSIDEIVNCVSQVTDMVQRIAVAAEEQSSTSEDISRNMEQISAVTRELKNSFADIQRSSGDLSQLALELNGMVGWFKV